MWMEVSLPLTTDCGPGSQKWAEIFGGGGGGKDHLQEAEVALYHLHALFTAHVAGT